MAAVHGLHDTQTIYIYYRIGSIDIAREDIIFALRTFLAILYSTAIRCPGEWGWRVVFLVDIDRQL
jgi:hypothetical protein